MNRGIQGFTGVYRGDRGLQNGICKIAGRLYVNYHEVYAEFMSSTQSWSINCARD